MTGGNIRMKFRIHAVFLSLFFALALCFSFNIEASAHDYERSDGQKTYSHSDVEGVTAEDVENASAADKEEMTKKFLLHTATHLHLIQTDESLDPIEAAREMVIFEKKSRELGTFNHGDTYVAGITRRGAVRNHGRYQDLFSSRYDLEADPVKTLTTAKLFDPDSYDPTCVPYEGRSRVACATKQNTPAGVITTIVGFHHEKGDLIEPDCSAFTLEVTAKQVEDETDLNEKRKLLKDFVQGFRDKILDLQNMTRREAVRDGFSPGTKLFQDEANARAFEKVLCFREPDFFHGSIYPFVMDPVRGVSFLNALDFDIHGLSVSLIDPDPIGDEPNVLFAFQKALTEDGSTDVRKEGNLKHGNSGTVTYHWDNPVKDGDEVANFLSMGVVPGNSIKESYIEVVDIIRGIPGASPVYFVFGSGIYLDPEDDDDGCSIAATASTHQSALLNLFLIASVLFSVVFLRKRI